MPTWDKSSTWLDASINLGAANTWTAAQTIPTIIGGTGTTSTLTLQSTSGVGATGADIIFKVGNNGATEAARILNNGNVGIGTTSPGSVLDINGRLIVRGAGGALTGTGGINADATYLTIKDNNGNDRIFFAKTGTDTGNSYYDLAASATGSHNFRNAGGASILMTILTGGNVGIGTTGPASLLDLRAGDLTFSGANGQKYVQGRATELVAVGSGLTTKATTIQIPADAIVYAIPVRVVTQPGGTATMTVTATTSATAFQKGANISTTAGTTDPGTKNTPVNYNGTAAQTVTFTFNVATTDALGSIRVDIYYATSTPPTS